MDSMSWMSNRNCKDAPTRIFYADEKHPKDIALAKAYCAKCPVVSRCLQAAIKNNEFGIWGGMTEDERRTYKNSRLLRDLRQGNVRRKEQRDRERLESVYPSSQEHTSYSLNRTQLVFETPVGALVALNIVLPAPWLNQLPEAQSSDSSQTLPVEHLRDAS